MVDKKSETYIDPNFFLPPSVFDIRYSEKDIVPGSEENATATTQQNPVDSGELAPSTSTYFQEDSQPELPIPDNITVVSQTVKADIGGGYLVDLIIDIPDLFGVENFDVAVTKA